MHKLNLITFYNFGKEMRTLPSSKDKPLLAFNRLTHKNEWLTKFLAETQDIPFPKTRDAAMKLLTRISEVQTKAMGSFFEPGSTTTTVISPATEVHLKKLLADFEGEFDHDSREINVFSVPHRCAYSTTILIERGEDLLPPAIKNGIDAYAQHEIQEAAKCLAFGLPSAAGFHLARGVESVLRRYYDVLSGGAPRPKLPNGNDVAMFGYIDQVRGWAEAKVVSVLEQFTRLHRNPISHPGAVLEEEEALTLVGITVSTITAMVNDAKSKGHSSLA